MAIRIHNLEVPVLDYVSEKSLTQRAADILNIPADQITHLDILKRSLDARKKSRIVYRYQVDVEVLDEQKVALSISSNIAEIAQKKIIGDPLSGINLSNVKKDHTPVIIGTGPAGIFAALTLAKAGVSSILIERGEPVETRLRTVNTLRRRGILNAESNYCFGEGGAGTFSDGKLTCGKNHPLIRHVFETFVKFGAPADILFDSKPHIGTDFLMMIAKRMRNYLVENGSVFHFKKLWTDFVFNQVSNRYELKFNDGTSMEANRIIIAIGHSARDTYQMLLNRNVAMVPKPFAIGARIEHPQEQINTIQFGNCPVPTAAEYKLATQALERGIWTFCMCPGGHLLPTSAQDGHLAINGMSYHGRKSGFANAAVVVNVLREDFFKGHVLDGMRFQEELEKRAFAAGGGRYFSPAQRLTDFVKGQDSQGELRSTYRPGVMPARMDHILPPFVVNALRAAVIDYDKSMRGFLSSNALVVGLESKTSSPVSMVRDVNLQSVTHPGIFPAGEGAGFAGGIVSAALDGLRVGRAVLESICR